jgi:signal transduction histidine kinase
VRGPDRGYEGHKRIVADAAHELRTLIAILTTRTSALQPGPEMTRLLEDTTRLTVLTGQVLDLQRFDRQQAAFAPVDFVALADTKCRSSPRLNGSWSRAMRRRSGMR